MTKLFAATALATLLAASPALAQTVTPAPATTPATTGSATMAKPDIGHRFISASQHDWVASRLIGSAVYDPANMSLGDINDIVADKDGRVKAVVIGVGGFLGIGEKNVAVIPADLKRVAHAGGWRYQLNTTKEELNAAPEFRLPEPPAALPAP